MISIGPFFSGPWRRGAWHLLCGGIALALAGPALAQESVTVNHLRDYAPAGQWQLTLALGYGQLQSPLSDGKDIELQALAGIKYYGERFYIENTSLGYSLYESPRFALDLAGRLNTDGLFFPHSGNRMVQSMGANSILLTGADENPWEVLDPPKRRLSYLGGFALQWLGPVDVALGAYRDITGVHGGDEIPLTLSKRIGWHGFGGHGFEAGLELGATYQSRELVDYYYGADLSSWEPEPLPIYHPGAALNKHAKLEARYRLSEAFSLVMAGRRDWFDREIWQSPFVIRRDTRAYFVGLQYSW